MIGCAFMYMDVFLTFSVQDLRSQNYESCMHIKLGYFIEPLEKYCTLNAQCIQTVLMLKFVFIFSVLRLMDLQ